MPTCAGTDLTGRVLDPQGRTVAGATVRVQTAASPVSIATNEHGEYKIPSVTPGPNRVTVEAPGFLATTEDVVVEERGIQRVDVTLSGLVGQHQSVVITGKTVEAAVDLRNAEVFNRTLFTRDDQVMQQLNAGINAGQHEGGGKSLEIRRFGFNLDHGGVNG
jgi:hypothetical protein